MFFSLSLVGVYVYGQTTTVYHPASEITAGNFQTGTYGFQNTSKVGIGTTSPTDDLSIKKSSITSSGISISAGRTDDYRYKIASVDSNNYLGIGYWTNDWFPTAGTPALVLTYTGNVGIGNKSPSSDWKVDISGSLVSSGEIRSGSLFYSPLVKVGPIVADDKYPHLKLDVDTTYQNNGADIAIKTSGVQGNAGVSRLIFDISNHGGDFIWRFGSADGPVNVMSLSNRSGDLHVLGTIKSTGKKQLYDNIPISTLDNYHSGCNICPSGTDNGSCALVMMYCTAACHRYCNQEYGYSGGTLVEHDSGKKEADCLCVP